MGDWKEYLIHIIWAFAFAIIAAIIYEKSHNVILLLSISFLAIVALILIEFHRRSKEKIKALKEFYTYSGKTSALAPDVLLGMRPFDKYYYRRKEDDLIDESLKNKKNLLIIGRPLSGKTRAVYEALINLDEPKNVIIPRIEDINPTTFLFPENTEIIFIDDLHKFVEKQNFEHLLNASIKNNITVVATCRSEMEYKKAKNKIDLETIFKNIIELPRISNQVGEEIANKVKIEWDKVRFDGTVGSIFMRLREMKIRFDECNDIEKTILQTLRNLYICGIYEEKQLFPLEWIKIATKKVGLEGKDFEWTGWLENLRTKELLTLIKKDKVQAEEVYLEDIFLPEPPWEIEILDVFEEAITTFSEVPEALFRLGNRAYSIGNVELEKARYMKIAIKAYDEALKIYTPNNFPTQTATIMTNLGYAYTTLAWEENKAESYKKAIRYYEESLKVYTSNNFPMGYASTQKNLGKLYMALSKIENKTENSKKAIRCYEEALKVYTPNNFPMLFARAQNFLVNIYMALSKIENSTENSKKAIRCYEEALKVYTPNNFPMQYASTQKNLGKLYMTLSKIENKTENYRKAIRCYEEALKVYTPNNFPMQYAETQNNLGNAYSTLAEVEANPENCKRAIKAYEEALKVRTFERFPMDYAMTQNNLGSAYRTLAEVEAKPENCKRAIKAYEEALKVFTEEEFPEIYMSVMGNLTGLLDFCGSE